MTLEQRERKRERDREAKRRARARARNERVTADPRSRVTHPVLRAGADMPDLSEGLCARTDEDLWFSDDPEERERAKQICLSCPVRSACHQLAEANQERFGVWAGVDREETRKRRQVAA